MDGPGEKWRKVGISHYRRISDTPGKAEYDVILSQGRWIVKLVAGPCEAELFDFPLCDVRAMKARVSDLIQARSKKLKK